MAYVVNVNKVVAITDIAVIILVDELTKQG